MHAGSDASPRRPFLPSFGGSAEAELQPSEVQHGLLRVGTYVPNRIGLGDVALPSLQASRMTEVDLRFYERVATSTRERLFLRNEQSFCTLFVGFFVCSLDQIVIRNIEVPFVEFTSAQHSSWCCGISNRSPLASLPAHEESRTAP